jgi:hypothetical protein
LSPLPFCLRTVAWLTILISLLSLLNLIPQRTIAAMKSIILFIIMLALLIYLRLYDMEKYQLIKWFCLPGCTFHKSWTSLFFYVYIVQLPVELSSIPITQIISWLFQIILGINILSTAPVIFVSN